MSGRYSPWAERFKEVVDEEERRPLILTEDDGTIHSGIAMQYPSKHPRFYNDPTPVDGEYDKPRDGAEYDRFFQSVHFQTATLAGGQTTRLAALNRYLYVSNQFGIYSGGHRSLDDPNEFYEAFRLRRFSINPDGWFDFLKKHRWYDLDSVSDGSLEDGPYAGPWSVDNPPIWENLLGSLELADRLLKALIEDGHSVMEAMLIGRIMPWESVERYTPIKKPYDGAAVLISPEMEQQMAAMDQSRPWKSLYDGLTEEKRIEVMTGKLEEILSMHMWTFSPVLNGWGFTMRAKPEYNYSTLTALNAAIIKRLVTEDITLAERFMLQFKIATLMIHELMHVIMSRRYMETGIDWRYPEPFMDFDPIGEIGEAVEHRIFGGRYLPAPGSALPLGILLYSWPRNSTGGEKNPYHPIWQTPITSTMKPFLPLFISKLFSAEFWDNPFLPKKSDKRFWTCEMFKDYELDKTQEKDWDRFESAIAEFWYDTLYEETMYRQSWLIPSYNHWIGSPWGCDLGFLTIFVTGFQKDEFACWHGAEGGRSAIAWENRNNFFTLMPRSDELLNGWIYFALGLLMYAAMPVRQTEYSAPSAKLQQSPIATFKPGMEAEVERKYNRQWNVPEKIETAIIHASDAADRKHEASVLYDPFEVDPLNALSDVVIPDPSVTQMKYLALVNKVLKYIKDVEAVVSKPWYLEITRCARELESQRLELIAEHPATHLTYWAKDWPLKSPKYRPFDSYYAKWSHAHRDWQPVHSGTTLVQTPEESPSLESPPPGSPPPPESPSPEPPSSESPEPLPAVPPAVPPALPLATPPAPPPAPRKQVPQRPAPQTPSPQITPSRLNNPLPMIPHALMDSSSPIPSSGSE